MENITLEQLIEKYKNIESKIPSIWENYSKCGTELAQDLLYHWDIEDSELIRVICLVQNYAPKVKITQHIKPERAFKGLYPEITNIIEIPSYDLKVLKGVCDFNLKTNYSKKIQDLLNNF